MLEKFEQIYTTKEQANSEDWEMLNVWLTANAFPDTSFPNAYILLLSESNGGGYIVGEREYQFLSLREATEYYEIYQFAKYMPFAFPFAMDGCGNFYIFNKNKPDECVYGVSAGNLGWEQDECFLIAGSFAECLTQRNRIEEYFI